LLTLTYGPDEAAQAQAAYDRRDILLNAVRSKYLNTGTVTKVLTSRKIAKRTSSVIEFSSGVPPPHIYASIGSARVGRLFNDELADAFEFLDRGAWVHRFRI
jgi:hypothetical protein